MHHISSTTPQPSDPVNLPQLPGDGGDARRLVEDVSRFLGIARRGWRFILIGVVVCLTAGGIYLARAKPSYQASARLLVLQGGGRPLNVSTNDPLMSAQVANDSLSTQLMVISSPMIIERALVLAKRQTMPMVKVLRNLKVVLPDSNARVIELRYDSQSHDEANQIIASLIESYNEFLRDNYQKNSKEVISLIISARDDLSRELKDLEEEYLEYRRAKPSHLADSDGRSFITRRLEQWDQVSNQIQARALQLQSQLEVARLLSDEGAGLGTVTSALNQIAGVSGGSAISPVTLQDLNDRGDSTSVEGLQRQLAEIESSRISAELLVKHLHAEQARLANSRPIEDAEVAKAFYSNPAIARLRAELDEVSLQTEARRRVARSPSDPSITHYERHRKQIQNQLDEYWHVMRPEIIAEMQALPDSEAIQRAEAEVIALRAQEAAIRDRMQSIRSDQLFALRGEQEYLVAQENPDEDRLRQVRKRIEKLEGGGTAPHGSGAVGVGSTQSVALIESIEKSLDALGSMKSEIEGRFESDLAESKEAELDQLTEANLRSNLERQRTLFESVAAQLKQAQLVSDFGSVTAQVLQPPMVATIQPRFALVIALSLILGSTLGFISAFVSDLIEAQIRTEAEMRSLLDLPVLTVIPQIPKEQIPESGELNLLSHEAPRSMLAESYKAVRIKLEFLKRYRRAQVLLVSSPNPADGKSTTSSNLAISLAHAGKKVLLVDCDLRKPSLHEAYGLHRDLGISQILRDGIAFGKAVQVTSIENLHLLATGPDVPNPAEVLSSDRLPELVQELRLIYDVIIIDTSPLLAVTDPWIVSAVADGILLVVRIGQTRRQDVERVVEVLRALGAPTLGTVINGVSPNHSKYGYGYGRPYGTSVDAPEKHPGALAPSPASRSDLAVLASPGHEHGA